MKRRKAAAGIRRIRTSDEVEIMSLWSGSPLRQYLDRVTRQYLDKGMLAASLAG